MKRKDQEKLKNNNLFFNWVQIFDELAATRKQLIAEQPIKLENTFFIFIFLFIPFLLQRMNSLFLEYLFLYFQNVVDQSKEIPERKTVDKGITCNKTLKMFLMLETKVHIVPWNSLS